MSEWQPLIDVFGQYHPKFRPDKIYGFKTHDGKMLGAFRLKDQSPYFNVANVYWRDASIFYPK